MMKTDPVVLEAKHGNLYQPLYTKLIVSDRFSCGIVFLSSFLNQNQAMKNDWHLCILFSFSYLKTSLYFVMHITMRL